MVTKLSKSSNYDLAILITGSHMKETYEVIPEFLAARVPNVVLIGDGTRSIISKDSNSEFFSILEFLSTSREVINSNRILVISAIHGNTYEGKHVVVDNNGSLYSRDLFHNLAVYINKPMDIISLSCHGAAAFKDIDVLPMGSKVVFLSDPDESTILGNGLMSFYILKDKEEFSLEQFYDNYLWNLGSDGNAWFAEVNGIAINPKELSANYLNKNISAEAVDYVKDNLGKNICLEDINCQSQLEKILSKISLANKLDEFKNSVRSEVIVALILDQNVNLKLYQEFFVNSTLGDTCPKEIQECGEKINMLFYQHEFPLEINLAHPSWYEEDDEDEDELELEGLSEWFFYMGPISYGSFIPSSKFPAPSAPTYGKVLSIIKALYKFEQSQKPVFEEAEICKAIPYGNITSYFELENETTIYNLLTDSEVIN